jgi:hypothetical protein
MGVRIDPINGRCGLAKAVGQTDGDVASLELTMLL